ncbi:MAG TPA: hypothetical protein VGG15_11680 [Terriglobales bacterium]
MKLRIAAYALLPLLCCVLTLPLAAQSFNEDAWGRNSPGVELQAVEGPRAHSTSGTALIYNLVGKGFPANQTYSLWGWIPGQKPRKAIAGVSFDHRGVLVCSGKPGGCTGQGLDDPVNIKTTAVLGEPKRFAVVSDDGKIAGFAEAVPFPIEATNKSCKLSVVRESPLAETVLVRATGFVPYEMLNISAHLGGEDTVHSPTTSADGTWQAIIGVKAPGKDSGTASIKVSGQQCSVSLTFNWGEGSAKEQ